MIDSAKSPGGIIFKGINGGGWVCDAEVLYAFEVLDPGGAKDFCWFITFGGNVVDTLAPWVNSVTHIKD